MYTVACRYGIIIHIHVKGEIDRESKKERERERNDRTSIHRR